jgi:iron complex outermembrane recepter protein
VTFLRSGCVLDIGCSRARERGAEDDRCVARRTGEVDSRGYYAAVTLRAPQRLTFNGGIRFGRFSTDEQDVLYASSCDTVLETVLVDVDPGPGQILVPIQVPRQVNCSAGYAPQAERSAVWHNRGANLGLTWEPVSALTLFTSLTRTFRNPNVDELLFAAPGLHPQTGTTFEVGARYAVGGSLELAATLFHMRVEDEIVYAVDPVTGLSVNGNLEHPTRRIGAEIEARWQVREPLAIRTSAGYVQARIPDAGTTIPLVPSWTASAEVDWALRAWLRWGFSARYVGSRYDGNDFDNTLCRRLPAYVVCDTKLRVQRGAFELSAGINNLFNEVYSTIAYSETYYPMPERNYYVALSARF